MTTTFTHSGDEHMDSDAHGTINPKTGINTAWESNYRVVRFLAEEAVARKVKFHVSSGDNFKTGRPSQEAILMFVDALSPLAEAKIPIILLDGNHHMTGVSSDHRTVIHVVAEMLRARGGIAYIASEPTLIRLDSGEHIAALPWLSRNRVLNELDKNDVTPAEGDRIVADYGIRKLTEMAEAAESGQHLIMASHVTVDDLRIDAVSAGFTRGSEVELAHLFSEPVLARKKLEALPFEYGALSHIHTPQAMGKTYHYAGSPNRLTFTDMPDIKGGNFVTLGDDKSLTVERIVTPARVMASIDLDKPGAEDAISDLEPGTLVQVWLQTGDPEMPRDVRKGIAAAGATIADTRARPTPRPQAERIVLPEKVDPVAALRAWAEHNLPEGIDAEVLVAAAATLEVAA
jgi:exonuclease SbcD